MRESRQRKKGGLEGLLERPEAQEIGLEVKLMVLASVANEGGVIHRGRNRRSGKRPGGRACGEPVSDTALAEGAEEAQACRCRSRRHKPNAPPS